MTRLSRRFGPAQRAAKARAPVRVKEPIPRSSEPPDFKDERAVSDYVNETLTVRLRDIRRLPPPLPRTEKLEEDAVRLAALGNYMPLADLLREQNPLNAPELDVDPWERLDFDGYQNPAAVLPRGQIRSSLAPSTYELIADILEGKHKRRGRPAATAKDRRKMTQIHNAADFVPTIVAILREAYPDSSARSIKTRAITLAALRTNSSPETLRNFLNRKLTDRRRLLEP